MGVFTLGIVAAVIIGGLSMGAYFAAFHNFQPPRCTFRTQFITLCTIGLSFLVPLAIEVTLFEHGQMGMQWFAVFILWVIFSFFSTASNTYLSTRSK
jgi:hypothetical protein